MAKFRLQLSKFNAYFPRIAGSFHLQICAVFSLTNVNLTFR